MRSVDVQHTRQVWAEVSAGRLQQNYRCLCEAAGLGVQVLAVVKANAYGHGATECAPVLVDAGARWLGVTSVEEGTAVRESLLTSNHSKRQQPARILVMCGLWRGEESACLEHELTPVVWENYHLDLLEQEARRRALPPDSVAVHVEIDTGMSRQGVSPGASLAQLLARFTSDFPQQLAGVGTGTFRGSPAKFRACGQHLRR